ncbi:hypothetical protein FUSO7_10815 [Fusobacterium necrophorum BFTR-2]|nr:hypothetical protein FUSO7_10815 [Fusobacterium necrophorum BFTR-2]
MAEQLLLSTVRIETPSGTGTGFLFTFKIKEEKECLVLITNSHVIESKPIERIKMTFHSSESDLTENIDIEGFLEWHHHAEYDLCFSYIHPVFLKIKERYGFYPKIRCFSEEYFLKDQKINLLEEITMVGYPIGLHDIKNNLPLFRKGYTATHPSIDFNGSKIGIVDMACFPGSSGSPIFILNEGSYLLDNTLVVGNRLIFLGILYSGPIYNANGILETRDIDMKLETIPRVGMMTNLGYYIKAEVILDFKEKIIEDYNK